MKIKFLNSKILILLLSLLSIFFFLSIFYPISQVKADIEAISGNNYVLTAGIGNTNQHYFRDKSNNSTLVNAKASNEGGDYYSLVPTSGLLLGKTSSGYAIVRTTNDINVLIEKGVVYAQVTFSFQAKNNNSQSNIEVTFTQGNNQTSVSTNYNGGNITEYASEMIKIDSSSSELKFEWSTLAKTEAGKYSDFVLSMPTIKLFTIIDSVSFGNDDQIVSAGGSVKLSASNEVLSVNNVSGNFLNFSKVNHAIIYDVLQGSQYVDIIGNTLYISDDAPNSTVIKVQAKCKANSYSDDYILSEKVLTLTVSDSYVEVKVQTDFENPPKITGEGVYLQGRKIFLHYTPQSNFIFEGWYINGTLQSTDVEFLYTVNANDVIYAKFIKEISVTSIGVNNKIYDGTTNINQDDTIFNFDGVEENHEVFLTGTTFSFATASAGTNKAIVVEDASKITLDGKDSQYYKLKSQLIPQSYAEILKRDLIITPTTLSKQYGDADSAISYVSEGLLPNDSLQGNLTRESGENVGVYKISLGTLSNSNYDIKLSNENYNFTITKRQLTFAQIYAEDKVYDQSNEVPLNIKLTNIYNNEDVGIEINAYYKDANAGYGKEVIIQSYQLIGEDKNNYQISMPTSTLYGNIIPKSITVEAESVKAVYGDDFELTYRANLLDGDTLRGELTIEDENVGVHQILLGTLSNENYSITFVSANCEIIKRDVIISANHQTKEYGDGDPILTYSVENLVEGDSFSGNLSRENGEEIGRYIIKLGSLSNSNYNITFVEEYLEILPRAISVEITFEDKQYDGTNQVTSIVKFQNALQNQVLELQLEADLESKDVGKVKVNVQNYSINGENLGNFEFDYVFLNEYIQIRAREVVVNVDSLTKIYGDNDPEIKFSVSNIVQGESLTGSVKRNSGEDVGQYLYYLDDLNSANNPNYSITLNGNNVFSILPRDLNLRVDNLSKTYGNEDPEFNISLINTSQLQFNDTLEDVIVGILTREEGENVGIYQIKTDNMLFSDNYNIIFEDLNFIINKRPITIVADDATKVYGDEDPEFTYSATNLVEGQPVNVTIKRVYGENVGEYEMVLESSNDSRYSITFVPGVLNITKSKITLKAESKVKIYGDEDPYYDAIIVDGLLKNNDILSNIIQGQMVREQGENVGRYQINQGTYNLGQNYQVVFEPNILEIVPQTIQVTANLTNKQYGDADPIIGYKITSGELKFDDDFVGALSRAQGETLGSYEIYQGSLTLNENYILTFVSNEFVIEKRVIQIIPQNLSKVYGEDEPGMTYIIVGNLVNDDELSGYLYRDKPTTENDPYLYENVGSYKIYSTLQHDNYEIIFENYYFEVTPRVIEIKALDASKIYGEEDPQLEYQIISGEILDGDEITGTITRVAGENAGIYDIRSSLNLGRNYTIVFTKGVFVIKPIEIVVKTENYEKIYGQMDPVFTYTIVEGQLINNDILYGNISREQGEDVGVYKMISNLSNVNYNITIEEAYLVIEKKDVYMLASVYDKIYDGTDTATIKAPVVSGLVDKNVSLYYDKNNCARFSTSEVGDNLPVTFYDITLVGDKAHNYNLILPTDVTGSITYNKLASEEETVVIEALDSACLYNGTNLSFINFDIAREDMGLNKYQVITGFSIWLEKDGERVDLDSTIQLTIKLTDGFADRNNIYVYHKNTNGEYVLVNCQNENGEIVINIDELGEFVIMTDNDAWIDVVSYVCIGVLGLFVICYIIYLIRNKKKLKKYEE